MGLADKLLCEVIQFNLRAATIIIAAMNMVGRPLSSPSQSPGPTTPFSFSTYSWAQIKVCASLQSIAHIAKKIFTNHERLALLSFQHKCVLYIKVTNISVVGFHYWTQYFGRYWYFLCSSWNTKLKPYLLLGATTSWVNSEVLNKYLFLLFPSSHCTLQSTL